MPGVILCEIMAQSCALLMKDDLIGKLTFDTDSITTWSNGVARALKRYIKDGTETGEVCLDCGSKLVYTGGCKSCPQCGWSKCS